MKHDTPRPRLILNETAKRHPGAWRTYDYFRSIRGRDIPDWPDYVYAPMATAYAIISGGGANRLHIGEINQVSHLAALAAWRVTQGVYRFDPDLYAALIDTPMTGDLPCDVLRRMPEWCVYIETPNLVWAGDHIFGFFAHIEYDPNDGREELRLLLDTKEALVPIPIHLGPWSLTEAIERSLKISRTNALLQGMNLPDGLEHGITGVATPIVSLLLYLCSEGAEIGDGSRLPSNPEPKRTKNGWRLFAADNPTQWDVGVRFGAAYRKSSSKEGGVSLGEGHARPRAHMRRAHWHTYRVGVGRAETRLKWLHPIPVNVGDEGDLPAVVRKVH